MNSDSLAKIVLDRNLHQLSVRAKFFATGIQLFSESESKLPTVDDVVRSVGLSRATFYNYFRDMEAYVHFLVDESLGRLVMEVDETRRHFVARHFNSDVNDPLKYDLIFNMDRITVEEAARQIAHLVTSPDFRDKEAQRLADLRHHVLG